MSSPAVAGAGVVISAGKMSKTVTVRMVKREWHRHLRKHYYTPFKFLVHDPNQSLVEGDVISCEAERYSSRVKHVVSSILAPFGRPVEERPRIFSKEERDLIYESKFRAKNERRAARGNRRATTILRERGWPLSDSPEALAQSSQVEIGPAGQKMQHGRTILPDGKHKYGGRGEGGINKEAWSNKQKAINLKDRAVEHEMEKEEVESIPSENVAKDSLQRQ